MGKFVWTPTEEYIKNSNLKKFMDKYGLSSFEELQKKSVEEPEWFWQTVVETLNIEWFSPYEKVMDTSEGIPWTRWFVNGKLNIVHNCVEKRVYSLSEDRNRVAVIWEGENGEVRKLTYYELFIKINKVANALRSLGIRKGDSVGLFMPMIPEIVVAFLAIAKIGAISIPLFSGFGPKAIQTRLKDGDAKLLVTADGFYRRGKVVPMKEIADKACEEIQLDHILVFKRIGESVPMQKGRDIFWNDIVPLQPDEARTEIVDSDEPMMIIYTSGTTGRPKGACHTHTGFPIKSAQDMYHGFDVKKSDIMFWVTDMGWMMGPWEVLGITILGASMFIYEGALDYPSPSRLFKMVDRHGITVLGVSPTLIRSLMGKEEILERVNLSTLRILGSTGEPWNPEPWQWFFEKVGKFRCPIINYSGGTEISGGILIGNVLTPMKPCAFSGPVPGISADVVDEKGNSIRGEVGELVIRKPWVGMTQGFWKDPDRYIQTYWSRWENIWVHGDFSKVDEDNLWYILGRSDDTIKVAGKRVGPAEIESVLVSHPAVLECAAVGIPDPVKGESIHCFVILNKKYKADKKLEKELLNYAEKSIGKALKPSAIKFVKDLPKTRNAKVMRRVVKKVYLGEDPGDLSALENASAVKEIERVR